MPSLEYLITCLVVVLIHGAGVIYTVSTALVHGRRAGILAALACTLGILPHLLATILGVAAILHSSALVFETLRYAGAAYLLYLAYATGAIVPRWRWAAMVRHSTFDRWLPRRCWSIC